MMGEIKFEDYEKETEKFRDNCFFMRVAAIFFATTTFFLLITIIFLTVSTKWIPIIAISDYKNEQEFGLAMVKNNKDSPILSPVGQSLFPGKKALIVLFVEKNKNDDGMIFRLEWKMPDEKSSD